MNLKLAIAALPIAALTLALTTNVNAQPRAIVVSAACDVSYAVDNFKRYLGPQRYTTAANWSGYQNAGWQAPKGYRQITWDGVPKEVLDYDYIPNDWFNTRSPQGLYYSTQGKGFRVSSDYYSYLNPNYKGYWKPYSASYLFSPLYSNVLDVNFEVPGYKGDRAYVHGFGAIFEDVDKANTTRMEFFDDKGYSLGTWYAQPCDYGHSFLGVYFEGAWVTKVRIWLGDKPIDAYTNEDAYTDLVVLDDFIYDEPWKYGYTGASYGGSPSAPSTPKY
jgi:hypothetical protein